ncbi:phosphotransferase [Streptomyces avermitilis]|uniref:phosphotransferase n=1 Tax=Streptomyces avermitilis TaxID=33903 RepID=UPI00371CE27D
MSDSKELPPTLRAWAEREIGRVGAVRDVSYPREKSRVWELVRPDGCRFHLKVAPQPLMYERETFGLHGDAWLRNLLWSGARKAAWVDFGRSRFAPAVQEFVLLACGVWVDKPALRTACLRGYGRDLTPEEQHALKCLVALDAVSRPTWGSDDNDPDVTARGRRTLDRLTAGAFA